MIQTDFVVDGPKGLLAEFQTTIQLNNGFINELWCKTVKPLCCETNDENSIVDKGFSLLSITVTVPLHLEN